MTVRPVIIPLVCSLLLAAIFFSSIGVSFRNNHSDASNYNPINCEQIDFDPVMNCLNSKKIFATQHSRCSINFTFLNYTAPIIRNSPVEPVSYLFDLCRLCHIIEIDTSPFITKEAITLLLNYNSETSTNFDNFTISFLEAVSNLSPNTTTDLLPSHRKRPSGKYFSTCAIVGNSINLLNQSQGANIDKHEAVIRFNAGPTIGYERDVGHKSTIRLYNDHHTVDMYHENDEEILIATRFFSMDSGGQFVVKDSHYDYWNNIKKTLMKKKPKNEILFLGGRQVSGSGFLGIQAMSSWCESMTVYGFGYEEFEVYLHYFPDKERSGHFPVMERAELLVMNCTGIILLPDYLNVYH